MLPCGILLTSLGLEIAEAQDASIPQYEPECPFFHTVARKWLILGKMRPQYGWESHSVHTVERK
jgi:hypothetical protein